MALCRVLGKLTSTVLRGGASREAQTLPDRGARGNTLPRLYHGETSLDT